MKSQTIHNPLVQLLDDTFDKIRSSLLRLALSVGRLEGNWPHITFLVFESRTIRDLVWASMWLWTQLCPDG